VGGSGEGVLSHHALHLVDHTASNAVLFDDDDDVRIWESTMRRQLLQKLAATKS
jgi:hypothetical protein